MFVRGVVDIKQFAPLCNMYIHVYIVKQLLDVTFICEVQYFFSHFVRAITRAHPIWVISRVLAGGPADI